MIAGAGAQAAPRRRRRRATACAGGLLLVYAALLLQLPDAHLSAAETVESCPCPPAQCDCPQPPGGEGVCLTAVGCHGQGPLQVWQVAAFPEHIPATTAAAAVAEAHLTPQAWPDPAAVSRSPEPPEKVPR